MSSVKIAGVEPCSEGNDRHQEEGHGSIHGRIRTPVPVPEGRR
jgi:hypothetical protein